MKVFAAVTLALLAVVAAEDASAFVPNASPLLKSPKRSLRTTPSMKLGTNAQGLIGSDLEWPEFDPLGFTNNISDETLEWYRAAELKHGRVCMLAALGQLVQSFWHLPDPSGVFDSTDSSFGAFNKVVSERPWAAIQILLAIFAVEVLGAKTQAKPGQAPGDLDFDPFKVRSDDPEIWEATQLRELKNGRLAMIGITAMLVQEAISGKGVIAQWQGLGQS
ncbi:unnamed protein product [Vitrella brassicaformis CCMP3155]|uniref:Uncharacterized protein n=1 Tax=Vitrella brassicaformis (strain CCMP3155) TaxID=1169540 RepID=A0A0G4GYX1_VITBC|nr:unnamed protein product [Vitrella brassicaformis CCMP3155]|mmetsp:Transcript_41169/g.102814  ORF Transcript_41169/g.102814 Transcript_41169/m.102814 type:complete len:220 (-) Transcript_41169:282-941(-)|eukprot:CEM36363.1 unnamed protein product [Vitrella brassicaformis CCMP3155]